MYLVTGASRGLGLAAATVLVAEGARVVISGRDAGAARTAALRLGGAASVVGVGADNADPKTPGRLVEAAVAAFGRIDGALLSGPSPRSGTLGEVTDEDWRVGFEGVFLGALRLAREVAGCAGPGGSIAFVLSTAARGPIPWLAVSSGLRPGLAMAAKVLADEVGPKGIRVNGLLPGRMATEGLRDLDAEKAGTTERVRTRIPLGRDGTPEEFARVAAFVLSPAASYVSGALIPIDGGAARAL